MSGKRPALLVVEDDPFPRILQVLLDPGVSAERYAAFAHLVAHEASDFDNWCGNLRKLAGRLYPAEVRLVSTQAELRAALPEASAVMVESLRIGAKELAPAGKLKAIQKYGTVLSNIDVERCTARGIQVLTLRRRFNIGCAEHAFALMGMLAKKLYDVAGHISFEQLAAAGYTPKLLDGTHIPVSGWARVTGLHMLYEATLGIIGLGEIGREMALRAAAYGMRTLYHQRHRLGTAEEAQFKARYVALDTLLAESDWVTIHLPENEHTRGLIGQNEIGRMRRGAFLVNVARASIVERAALVEALRSGHLGGFALDPLYEEPGRADDELLQFRNVIVTPHIAGGPRTNGLRDFTDIVVGLSRVLR